MVAEDSRRGEDAVNCSRKRNKAFNKKWDGGVTFATLNVRSLGCKRADADFYYSYIKSLAHDATCLTEMWNTQRHYEAWSCVTSEENVSGSDKPAGVCIMLSNRFACAQINRGKLGTRGWWVRIQGPVCNLLIIGIYLPPQYSKTCAVGIMKSLKQLLKERSPHDCVILLGDFNIRLPRHFKDIVGPYAHAHLAKTLSVKKKSILHVMAASGLFAVNTYFRPRRRQSYHTWRNKRGKQRGQIDYIMASKRWRSCFTDSKVTWGPARFKHGKPSDHGMVLARFKWRLRNRVARRSINWRAIRPAMTHGVNPQNVNRLLDEYDAKCAELIPDIVLDNPAEAMETLNRVSVEVANKMIPSAKSVRAERMHPSPSSIEFAAARALEIGEGVTPQRERELHRKMQRMRRRDYRQWHTQSVERLDECVAQHRWHEARVVDRTLRGCPKQARKMPAKGYKQDVAVSSDADLTFHFSGYIRDLTVRRLTDHERYDSGWPEVQGDLSGPGAAWDDALFNWAVDRVHVGRAPGHNDIQVKLYKYSKWARAQLRKQLQRVWNTSQFPVKMITGVATPCHKSGDTDDYARYRYIVVFPAEYKIFATMLLKRIVSECSDFLSD